MNEEYPIFTKWYGILDWILDKAEKYPKNTRYTVASRIVNYALDVQELIIEAVYTKNRKDILQKINLLLEKIRIMFRISYDRRYISEQQYEYISCELNETGRMTGGWQKKTI